MSVSTLVVFLGSHRVGEVTRTDGPGRFRYDPAYLESDQFIPLSLSFQSTEEPQSQRVTQSWLQGILPAMTSRAHRPTASPTNQPADW